MANYITDSTQAALKRYQQLHPLHVAKQLKFSERREFDKVSAEILQAFQMLTNGLVATNRFFLHTDDVENLKMACIVHLFSKIGNYESDKSAFSFFNMIARNFFICEQNKYRRRDAILKQATARSLSNHEQHSTFGAFEEPKRCIPLGEGNRLPNYLTGETNLPSGMNHDCIDERERINNIGVLRGVIEEYKRELECKLEASKGGRDGRNKGILRCKIEVLENIQKMLADADELVVDRRIDTINALSTMSGLGYNHAVVMTAIRNVRRELVLRAKRVGAIVP